MYEFALNNIKLQRAIGFCSGNPDTGCVLAVYKKLGGAMRADYVEPVEEVIAEPASISDVMPVVEVEEPAVIEPAVIKTAVRKTAVKKVAKKTK